MRIAALADLHYPKGGRQRLEALAAACRRHLPDVLVLAGDLTTFSLLDFGRVLREFSDVAPVRLVVAGNHDVWTPGGRHTQRRYVRGLPTLCEHYGFAFLDQEPVQVDDVGFVGCLGWYDYSLRQLEEPVEGTRISPARPSSRSRLARLKVIRGREDLQWQDLTSRDYRGKAATWREGGRMRSLVWNDALYVDWRTSDGRVVARQVAHLRESARRLATAQRVVAVTHTVPCLAAFDRPYTRLAWAFCRAYMGAQALGRALSSDPRLVLWITGHVHYQIVAHCDGLPVVNVAAAVEQHSNGPTILELAGREVCVKRVDSY